jgi:cyclopropane fatty-acyl-phospholipid synthase-like methyltransferase
MRMHQSSQSITSASSPATAGETGVKRIRASDLARNLMGRVLNPRHLWRAAQLHRGRRAQRHAFDDAALELYSKILPDGFLHYGYFDDDDLDKKPEEMPLAEVGRGQVRYARMLLEHVIDSSERVLDVGCGMGGLCRMLAERGFSPVALTPDRTQAAYIAATQPTVQVIQSKFEAISMPEHEARYGTVIMSESLQYMKLDKAALLAAALLKPGGRWIVTDYFRRHPNGDRSCHVWNEFRRRVDAGGWRIVHERDITANVLPALAFIHMWGTRAGIPALHMATSRMRRRQPGLHHLLGGVLAVLEGAALDNLSRVDPQWFVAHRCYKLAVMEKPS